MVVTDIDMPELDGFEMMRCIRAINPRARAVYMSGAPEQYRRTLVSEAQNFGTPVLRKPFGKGITENNSITYDFRFVRIFRMVAIKRDLFGKAV
jgi:hypothetical protein